MNESRGDVTVLDRLETAVDQGGGRVLFHGDGDPVRVGVRELFEMAQVRAGRLRDDGLGVGDRIGIIGPSSPDWIAWAYAMWMIGGAYVPIQIPLRIRDRAALARQISAVADGFECTRIAAHDRFVPLVDESVVIRWEDTSSSIGPVEQSSFARVSSDAIARIIPTSGSTSAPKGVSRSYASTGAEAMARGLNPDGLDEVRYLTYAQIAQAAGLMSVVAPFEPWLVMHMLSPDRFARDPAELFRLIGRHGVMMLPAASSAIGSVLRAVKRDPDGVNLSSLVRLTLSFEMVDPTIVDRLLDEGGRYGLRPEAICAQYGLSEGGSTRTEPGKGIRIDEVDLDGLVADGVARPAVRGRPSKRIASCGNAYLAEMRIAGPSGALPDRHVGEPQFRGGTHLMQGYVGPGAEDVFLDDGWMSSGDIGYLADGELFVTGRSKEVVIQHGKKYHPEDIEWAAARGADVAPGECVAFTPVGADEGDIVIAVETALTEGLADLEQRVRAAVINQVGIAPRSVIFVTPETLPKTSSGKAQRVEARDRYARGELSANR